MKEENERKRVTQVVLPHLPTSEAVNSGPVFALILCRARRKFKGQRPEEASLFL